MGAEKKCIYCKNFLENDRVIDVCDRCGHSVWGEKMFRAIINQTNQEQQKGNLELGRVSEQI